MPVKGPRQGKLCEYAVSVRLVFCISLMCNAIYYCASQWWREEFQYVLEIIGIPGEGKRNLINEYAVRMWVSEKSCHVGAGQLDLTCDQMRLSSKKNQKKKTTL